MSNYICSYCRRDLEGLTLQQHIAVCLGVEECSLFDKVYTPIQKERILREICDNPKYSVDEKLDFILADVRGYAGDNGYLKAIPFEIAKALIYEVLEPQEKSSE